MVTKETGRERETRKLKKSEEKALGKPGSKLEHRV